KVLLCPPNVVNSAMLRNLGKIRTAILTGWAVDPNCRFRYQCDAAFPLSDHADFPDLVEFVKRVKPKKIYTLHGFAADFAQTLRELGFEAQALSQNEQLVLPLSTPSPRLQVPARKVEFAALSEIEQPATFNPQPAASFLQFALTCSRIAANPSKL